MLITLIGMSFFMASCEVDEKETNEEPLVCEEGYLIVDEDCVPIESACFSYEYEGTETEKLQLQLDELECKTKELYFEYDINKNTEGNLYWIHGDYVEMLDPHEEHRMSLSIERLKEFQEEVKRGVFRSQEHALMLEKISQINDLNNVVEDEVDFINQSLDLSTVDTTSFEEYNTMKVTLLDSKIIVYLSKNSRSPFDNSEIKDERIIVFFSKYDTLHTIDIKLQDNPLLPDQDFFEYKEFIEDEWYIEMKGTSTKLDWYYERNIMENTSIQYGSFSNELKIEYRENDDVYRAVENDLLDRVDYLYSDTDEIFTVFTYEKSDNSVSVTYDLMFAEGWDELQYKDLISFESHSSTFYVLNEGVDVGLEGSYALALSEQELFVNFTVRMDQDEIVINPLEEYGLTFYKEYDLTEIDEKLDAVYEMRNQEHYYEIAPQIDGIAIDVTELIEYFDLFRSEE